MTRRVGGRSEPLPSALRAYGRYAAHLSIKYFIICLVIGLTLTSLAGCRGPKRVPHDWHPIKLSFLFGDFERTVRIPWWWYARKAIDDADMEVYYVQNELNVSLGISVSEKLRERMISRYPTAQQEREGHLWKHKRKIYWRMGSYVNSNLRWAEVEAPEVLPDGSSLQFWYEQAPMNAAENFDLIIKQFLDAL